MTNAANAPSVAPNGLDDRVKRQLKTTVLELRRLLEQDLGRELRRLGIDAGKKAPTPVEELAYLQDDEREARRALDVALAREREAAASYREAVEALRREAVYTHLNRLVGLKCLELRGHLTIGGERAEAVTSRAEYGGRPKWLWTLRDREARYRHGEEAEELLWREGLKQACAAVSAEIHFLFDPEDPYAQVWPSHRALQQTVDALNALPEEAFRADELLGWVYQYFQAEEKDRVFEQARTRKKKIGGADIIPVTQLYTERYMVDFLLQNSIGRRWMEMYGGRGIGDWGVGIGGGEDDKGGDSVVPRSGGLAGGDEADGAVPGERTLWVDQPDAAGGGGHPIEHRRGAQAPAPGVSEPPLDSAGVAGRAGDATGAGPAAGAGDPGAGAAAGRPGSADRPSAARPRPLPAPNLADSAADLRHPPLPTPHSPIPSCWPYYVTPATPHTRPPQPLKEWTILDPCVGSGHFLVVAFDLLAQLYAEERRLAAVGVIPAAWTVPEEETANTILERNLHGIDIDPRAVQLATLALYLKGKELGLARPPRINVIAADATFMESDSWREYVAGFKHEHSVRRILEALTDSLKDIRELGSLLQPEVELERIIREEHKAWEERARRGAEQLGLFPELEEPRQEALPFEQVTDERFWEELAPRVENAIRAFLQRARDRGEIADQVVAGEAQKGFAFMELCRRRYDVVCTNPPYMGSGNMGPALSGFVAERYPAGKPDIYAAFVIRCRELAEHQGHIAMVTQQSWLFLRSFARFREASEEKAAKDYSSPAGLLRETTIETLAHLGEHGFTDPAAAGAFVVLFCLRNAVPTDAHRLRAYRLVGPKTPDEKRVLLLQEIASRDVTYGSLVQQRALLRIPGSPVIYWLNAELLEVFSNAQRFSAVAFMSKGLGTCNDARFVRFHWEVADHSERWFALSKGGGYARWHGLDLFAVDYENEGERIRSELDAKFPYLKGNLGLLIHDPERYALEGLVYSEVARGALGVRYKPPKTVVGHRGPGVFAEGPIDLYTLAGILNCRLVSFLCRTVSGSLLFDNNYLASLPAPPLSPNIERVGQLARVCASLKRLEVAEEMTEMSFRQTAMEVRSVGSLAEGSMITLESAYRHSFEGLLERMVFALYDLNDESIALVVSETGRPCGWYPLIAGYDSLPVHPGIGVEAMQQLVDHLARQPRVEPSPVQLSHIRDRLQLLLNGTPAAADAAEDESASDPDDSSGAVVDASPAEAHIPIPAETSLEEIAQQLELHPISVYRLVESMRKEGAVCAQEARRYAEDCFSVKLLRMLGHRWPMQDQYEKEEGRPFLDPKWVDADGIIPLTGGNGEETLIERLRRFLDEEFGAERGPEVEVEAGQILGWKKGDEWGQQRALPLERWLEREFFRRHVSQFKRRPIAWHLTSEKGAFQAIVYYHKFDRNRLTLLRSRYVREALEGLQRQVGEVGRRGLGGGEWGLRKGEREEIARLEEQIEDVREFDRRLGLLLEGRDREARIWCPWKPPEEQPVGWDPDINDGVRVNVAPVQRLGLLAGSVLSKKDLKSLLAPEERE